MRLRACGRLYRLLPAKKLLMTQLLAFQRLGLTPTLRMRPFGKVCREGTDDADWAQKHPSRLAEAVSKFLAVGLNLSCMCNDHLRHARFEHCGDLRRFGNESLWPRPEGALAELPGRWP